MAGSSRCLFLRLAPLVSSPRRNHELTPNPPRVKVYRAAAKSEQGDSDPLLRAALAAAWIRDQESHRSDPLFIDSYARGLLSSDTSSDDIGKCLQSINVLDFRHYRLATKFIDERLHQLLSTSDQFRQGLPLPNSISFEELLVFISSLAMKGSIFFGELHIPSDWIITGTKEEWLENVFLRHGFRVSLVKYSEVAGNSGSDSDAGFETPGSILFVAEQLRMSDAQTEVWRMHFERMEDEADEEGFEEL